MTQRFARPASSANRRRVPRRMERGMRKHGALHPWLGLRGLWVMMRGFAHAVSLGADAMETYHLGKRCLSVAGRRAGHFLDS